MKTGMKPQSPLILFACSTESCRQPDTRCFEDILNFTVPSGLFQGAFNEARNSTYTPISAEFIVKRDKDGNWKRNGTSYDNLMKVRARCRG